MKFFGREKEIDVLQKIERLSATYAQMTVVIGRRRYSIDFVGLSMDDM